MPLDERDKVAHLLRRAGFAARPEEIEAGVARGLEATAHHLLNFETIPDNLEPEPPGLNQNYVQNNVPSPPRGFENFALGWWMNAMIKTTRPLQEKMVLFWHHLFATSTLGVIDPRQMYLQNQLFRGYFNPLLPSQRRTPEDTTSPFPMGNFRNILLWLSRDPAMSYWLDNYQNRRKDDQVGTNENYARELLELFSMGVEDVVAHVPNYTETDVRQLSRVLTGWSVLPIDARNNYPPVEGQPNNFPRWFAFQPTIGRVQMTHDFGPYTVLGVTFSSTGADTQGRRMFDIIVNHKNPGQQQSACGRFLGYRLFQFFGYDDPEPEVINALADVFDKGTPQYNIKNVLRAIFVPGSGIAAEAFYSEKAFRAHIKSPTEYIIGTYRLLKPSGYTLNYNLVTNNDGSVRLNNPPSLNLTLTFASQMGQLLWRPFDVSGWKEGLNWINTTFDLGRFNWAKGFVSEFSVYQQSRNEPPVEQRTPGELTTEAVRTLLMQNNAQTPEQVVDFLARLLYQVPISAAARTALINYLRAGTDGTPGTFPFNVNNNATIDNKVRGLLHLMMTSPEYQLS